MFHPKEQDSVSRQELNKIPPVSIAPTPPITQREIDFFPENPYISETHIAGIGMANANIEDIKDGLSFINGATRNDAYQALRRGAHSGGLSNLGPGDLYVAFSTGGGFSNERTMPARSYQDFAKMNITRLRLRTDTINTQYRLAAQ